jgi:hypothetical protein
VREVRKRPEQVPPPADTDALPLRLRLARYDIDRSGCVAELLSLGGLGPCAGYLRRGEGQAAARPAGGVCTAETPARLRAALGVVGGDQMAVNVVREAGQIVQRGPAADRGAHRSWCTAGPGRIGKSDHAASVSARRLLLADFPNLTQITRLR